MSSPVLWGPNNYANNLQNAELTATGALLAYNGPKNYITYGNFENQLTTGWSLGTIGTLTNGLPTGSPTFGSGASGNLSIAVVTSGQLSGTASLSYVSSAATTAGNMLASQAYAIDVEDQAKVLGFKFSYSAISNASNANWSGTSSNSFGVAVYDVTNSVFLGVAGAFNIVQSSGTGIATGTFQTLSNTASIRFIVYNVNATTGAITLYFDSFQVGPQVTSQAPALSDFQTYNLAVTATTTNPTFGTVVTNLAKYRRVGDSIEIFWTFQQSSAGTAGSGAYKFSLPPGLTIDTSKITLPTSLPTASNLAYGGTCVGNGWASVTSAGNTNYAGKLSIFAYDSLTLCANGDTNIALNQYPLGSSSAAANFSTGNTIEFRALVPITGWSSNSVSSADTDTRVVASKGVLSANQTVTTGNTTIITFNNTLDAFDLTGSFNYTTGVYTVPVSGKYQINLYVGLTTTLASVYFHVYLNGVQSSRLSGADVAAVRNFTGSVVVNANAGTTIDVRLINSSGSSATLFGSTTDYGACALYVERISGPAVITATESVNARYTNTSGQSIPASALTTITGWTKDFDSHNAFNTSGIYTVPVSGKYLISFELLYASAVSTAGTQRAGYIIQAGSVSRNIVPMGMFVQATSTTFTWIGAGPTIINCLAGDTLTFQTYQTEATARSLSTDGTINQICIARVGN